jgi:hypothetical protein
VCQIMRVWGAWSDCTGIAALYLVFRYIQTDVIHSTSTSPVLSNCCLLVQVRPQVSRFSSVSDSVSTRFD